MLFAILNEPPKGLGTVHPRAAADSVSGAGEGSGAAIRVSCAEFLRDLEAAAKEIPARQKSARMLTVKGLPSTAIATTGQTRIPKSAGGGLAYGLGTCSEAEFCVDELAAGGVGGAACVALALGFITPLREKMVALVTGRAPEKHVAVLPFDNIGSNPENSALADGSDGLACGPPVES